MIQGISAMAVWRDFAALGAMAAVFDYGQFAEF
jgi:hypothetical protein